MTEVLIKGGRVLDPASGYDQVADVRLVDGKIAEIKPRIRVRAQARLIDAIDQWVLPGLIDMHTHLREPGGEHKEIIRTGTESAAAGGFTTLICMANTNPVNDNASVTRYIREQIAKEACVHVFPIGAATKELKGESLAEIGEMAQIGIIAVSDDGHCITNAQMMRKVMEYAKSFALPVIVHAEDPDFAGYAGINEGWVATQLGLSGSPSTAEAVMVARDCAIAALTRAHLHVAHVSTKEAVDIIREAKSRDLSITCEVTPHHLTLTEHAVWGFRTEAKVNPPLRTEEDRKALWKGLRDGTIDVIATDHAPHSTLEKETCFEEAASGMVGLETAVSLVWTQAEPTGVSPLELFAKLTCNPARILSLEGKGRLEPGADADVMVFDPRVTWTIEPKQFRSRSKNSPFKGQRVKGRVTTTVVAGHIVYEYGES